MIKKTVGKTDSIIRVLIAVIMAILLFTVQVNGILAIVVGVFGIAMLITGLTGYCLLYSAFGISTRKKKAEKPK